MEKHRIGIFGMNGVGKSTCLWRFRHNYALSEEDETTESDPHTRKCIIDGQSCYLELRDFQGQMEYYALRDTFYRSVTSVVIMYSVDNEQSFEEAKEIYECVLRSRDTAERSEMEHVPMILVGNKCDVSTRKVSRSDAHMFAQRRNMLYCECSGLNGQNVEEIFCGLVRKARTFQKQNPKTMNSDKGSCRKSRRKQKRVPRMATCPMM